MSQSTPIEKIISRTFLRLGAGLIALLIIVISLSISSTQDRVFRKRMGLYKEELHTLLQGMPPHQAAVNVGVQADAYMGFTALPQKIQKELSRDFTGHQEVDVPSDVGKHEEYWIWGSYQTINGRKQLVYVVENISLLELDAKKYFMIMLFVVVFASAIIGFLLVLLHKKTRLLVSPLVLLSQQLQQDKGYNLEPLQSNGVTSREIDQLIHSLNGYREHIKQLVDRERMFTRYASHELRTPLTVVKGVASLLALSSKPEFIDRQKTRLETAAGDMSDVIDTLLSLIRHEQASQESSVMIDEAMIEGLLSEYASLLKNKSVDAECSIHGTLKVNASLPVLRILLGNLIKNAFACTAEGVVQVVVDDQSVKIVDSGCGLSTKPRGHEGFGLGLLIVNDICRKYCWDFSLQNNSVGQGCTASIQFMTTKPLRLT